VQLLIASMYVNSERVRVQNEAVLRYFGIISRQMPLDCDKGHDRPVRIISTATVIRE